MNRRRCQKFLNSEKNFALISNSIHVLWNQDFPDRGAHCQSIILHFYAKNFMIMEEFGHLGALPWRHLPGSTNAMQNRSEQGVNRIVKHIMKHKFAYTFC